jgi:alanyl-tRNA synthetase
VRVITIGDYSKELCGGTHLLHTGFVGTFLITGESSIAAGRRRIEALVGEAASRALQEHSRLLHETARRLSRAPSDVVTGLEELLEQLKQAERERKTLQAQLAKVEAQRLVATAERIKEVSFVQAAIKHMDRESLALLADAVKRSLSGDGIVCLASGDGGTVSMVVAATEGLSKRVHAGNVLKAIAPLVSGSGGGRPDFAQGGGKDAAGIPAALKRAGELIREALDTR